MLLWIYEKLSIFSFFFSFTTGHNFFFYLWSDCLFFIACYMVAHTSTLLGSFVFYLFMFYISFSLSFCFFVLRFILSLCIFLSFFSFFFAIRYIFLSLFHSVLLSHVSLVKVKAIFFFFSLDRKVQKIEVQLIDNRFKV
jgi:hypothetical protein